jgi:hypothetical protein
MIGLQRRFDQNFKRVQVAVQRKEVGAPIMIKLCSRDPSPPPYAYVKVYISSNEETRHSRVCVWRIVLDMTC